jgi:hypothetical protein
MPRFCTFAATIAAMALTLATRTGAQAVQSPEIPLGQFTGTVAGVKGGAIMCATVILTRCQDSFDKRTAATAENGAGRFFGFLIIFSGV